MVGKKTLCIGIALSMLSGCSTYSKNISASYVSPLQYNAQSCNQVRQELMRVNRKILEVSGKQDREATKDAVALGVGLVFFWPALFFMIGEDKKEELARLKGEYEALESAAIQKECGVSRELAEAKKMRDEYARQQDGGAADAEPAAAGENAPGM